MGLSANASLVELCGPVCSESQDIAHIAGSTKKHVHITPSDPEFWWFVGISALLVLSGGVCSGSTLGLMGLDTINSQVLSQAGTPAEQAQAPKVLKSLNGGRHTVLVVSSLCNTLVNTSSPIFLDNIIGGGVIAILGATASELVFGEVIPQAICNKYGLAIGATFAPLVKGMIILLYPIAKPIALVSDYLFGAHDDGVTYRKAESKAFVALGVEDKSADEELALLGSVLEFSGKTVSSVMTPFGDVYQLPANRIVDKDSLAEILRKGHTRIPVYDPARPGYFVGVMLIRALVGYDVSDPKPVSHFVHQTSPQCPPDLSLVEAMNYFQTGRSHISLVSTKPGRQQGAVGIVTLEDIVEESIGKEIIDETDQFVDIHSRIPVVRPRYQAEHPAGSRRIFEGRVSRRSGLLGHHMSSSSTTTSFGGVGSPRVGSSIDYPTNA